MLYRSTVFVYSKYYWYSVFVVLANKFEEVVGEKVSSQNCHLQCSMSTVYINVHVHTWHWIEVYVFC